MNRHAACGILEELFYHRAERGILMSACVQGEVEQQLQICARDLEVL